MIGILLFSIICAYLIFKFIFFWINHAKKRSSFSHFPQLPSNFFLGETSLLKKKPITYNIIQRLNEVADIFAHQDKLFLSWMTVIPIVFIFNKNYIRQILSKNEPEFLNKGTWLYEGINDMLPKSLFTIRGDEWKVRRKILSTPFHTTNMNNFVEIMNFESERLINFLKKNPCKDTLHQMKRLAMFVFSKLLFEYDIDDEVEDAIRLANSTTEIIVHKGLSIFMISPALYRFTSLATEESKMLKGLMDFKNKMLDAKSDSLKDSLKAKVFSEKEIDGKSTNLTLIEILLKNLKTKLNDKTSRWSGFDMEEIRSQLDTFIVAGLDTVSTALTFLLYHLAKYENYQEKIYEEIQHVFGDNRHRQMTAEDIKKLVMLDAFINESLRIQPVAPIISRSIDTDITFDEKYHIPAGTDIVIFIDKVLNDPEYFPEPEKFFPERFFDQKDNLFTNIPFSAGTRNCVAKKIALNIMAFTAVDLLRNFKIEFAPSTPKELDKKTKIKFEGVNKPIDIIELKFVERI